MKLKALLFDMDGTLADTDRLHEQGWVDALRPYGVEADHHFYQTRISGKLNPDIVADILPQLSKEEAQVFMHEKEARFREVATDLPPLPGLTDLLQWAKGKGLKLALVTNANRLNAEHVTEMLGLQFDTEVMGEELERGKPHPLPYLTALEQLGLVPEQAVAFEDSPSGIRSAVGAGLRTVALTTGHKMEHLETAGAFMAVPDFTDVRLWDWLKQQV